MNLATLDVKLFFCYTFVKSLASLLIFINRANRGRRARRIKEL